VSGSPLRLLDPLGLQEYHHWFPVFRPENRGQIMVDSKCLPPISVRIHDFTTPLDNRTHTWLHNPRGFNYIFWAKEIYKRATDCCDLLLGVQTLRRISLYAIKQMGNFPYPTTDWLQRHGGSLPTDLTLDHWTRQACCERKHKNFDDHWKQFIRVVPQFDYQDWDSPFGRDFQLMYLTPLPPSIRIGDPDSFLELVDWYRYHEPEDQFMDMFSLFLLEIAVITAVVYTGGLAVAGAGGVAGVGAAGAGGATVLPLEAGLGAAAGIGGAVLIPND
ncbi:MAG: hypothetical protein N2C12_00370, partial [Planctomycetales bacterium]